MQCCHLSNDGQPCPLPAIHGSDFCADHMPLPVGEERIELAFFFRLIRWVGAVFLLGLVLLQMFVAMRELYQP